MNKRPVNKAWVGKVIGVDIGGTHVSAGFVDINGSGFQNLRIVRKDMNAFGSASEIVASIAACIHEVYQTEEKGYDGLGIALPGPFDYPRAISKIANVGGKFENLFGLHVGNAIKEAIGLPECKMQISNDAHCFAEGAFRRYQLNNSKTIFVTIGTGFGSAFFDKGVLVDTHPLFQGNGALFNRQFSTSTADDYFSSRWFLAAFRQKTGIDLHTVKDLADINDAITDTIFRDFGKNLGQFISSLLPEFPCEQLVIGGNISKSSARFSAALQEALNGSGEKIKIIYCEDTEECSITGAAFIASGKLKNPGRQATPRTDRKAIQPLLPVLQPKPTATSYDVFPFIHSDKAVNKGFESLAEKLLNEMIVVIDGFGGVLWENFISRLMNAMQSSGKKIYWYNIEACLKNQEEVDGMISESLDEGDPVFGKKYNGKLRDFFDPYRLQILKPDPSADLCIVYGTGATLSGWEGTLVYADVPKNEIQYRMRAGRINNIGNNTRLDAAQTYRRFYFVDWPVLNKHKESLLPAIDCFVDEQRINEITWMEGHDFRITLDEILNQPFRARPWFEAGIWGGHWMKKNIKGLNENEINYAWSFELITPENGIVIEGKGLFLEATFDFLLFRDNTKLLGKAASRFGNEFPIRFDFLDTYVGGNLSIQCHPRTDFIREKFGESFTQDETYYILDCEQGANVYLGFQDNINPQEFKAALLNAQNEGVELPVEKYVQKMDTRKHELYLIPNGTIHSSGKNNLVLEISSTPYIFTFKMYDWLRLDLNGKPRPINIDYAFENLYFDRKGDYVPHYLISKPQVAAAWASGRKMKLPTHEQHFYTIDRYEFTGTIHIETNGQCHICMLVQGKSVMVVASDKSKKFSYAETFVIPASISSYEVQNPGKNQAYLVVAYVKDDCC